MRRAYFCLFSILLGLSPACGPNSNGGGGGGAISTGGGGATSTGTAGGSATGGGAGAGGAGAGGAETGGAAGRAGSGTSGAAGVGAGGSSGGGASGSGGTTGSGGAGGSRAGAGGAAGNGTAGTGGAKDGGAGTAGSGGGSLDAGPRMDASIDAPGSPDGGACAGIGAENVELGTPTDADPSDDVLLAHDNFVISYNPQKNDPNWVSWHLNASDIGSTARQDNFSPDALLPAMYYHVKTADYTGSGYDRGHVSPSADNTSSVMANSDSFLMTNMMPQYHQLNAGPWELLETFERSLALTDKKEVYIIAGPVFDPTPTTIGPGIAVPKACFKIVIALDAGQGPCDITAQTPIYAAIMPNTTTTTGTPWGMYTTSIDDVEMQTGYDFLSGLPLNIQTTIESVITKAP